MELEQALDQARLIVNEERMRPTLKYSYVSDEWPHEFPVELDLQVAGLTPSMAGPDMLTEMRKERPRVVWEHPSAWKFESDNFDLLGLIYGQLSTVDRPLFLDGLLETSMRVSGTLALIAEFYIRSGFLN